MICKRNKARNRSFIDPIVEHRWRRVKKDLRSLPHIMLRRFNEMWLEAPTLSTYGKYRDSQMKTLNRLGFMVKLKENDN